MKLKNNIRSYLKQKLKIVGNIKFNFNLTIYLKPSNYLGLCLFLFSKMTPSMPPPPHTLK